MGKANACPSFKSILAVTNEKPKAIAYIDDRAIKFDGNYDNLYNEINDFKPHWK